MKELKFIFVLSVLIIILLIVNARRSNTKVEVGCISFISMTSNHYDSFEIKANVDIPPRTIIRFTDSEWNGNRFGFDENDMVWTSGDSTIKAQSIIKFSDLNSTASVSIGAVSGSMKLSSNNDAIFAYIGNKRMPTQFLAAIANNEFNYGTLINTGLVKGETAVISQGGTTRLSQTSH